MIGEIRQNFTEASASVGLILATALIDYTTRFPTVTIYFIYLFIYLGASGLHS